MRVFWATFFSVLMCMAGLASSAAEAAEAPAKSPDSAKLVATRQVLRDLWTDHIFWVRAAVVAKHDKNAEAGKVAEAQVVANAHQIADAVVPFYGKDAGAKLFDLLGGHWGAIKAYLDTTDAKDAPGAQKAQQDINENAHAIAKFLSGANPNWPYDTVNVMLIVHGAQHVAQIQQIYAGTYDAEAKNWQEMRMHMNKLGDALANGLAAQFPDKF